MWLFVVIAAILAVLIYPYAYTAFCRRRVISQLRHKLKGIGGKFKQLRKFALFSSNRAPKYDLLIEKNGIMYAVKLWSAVHKNTDLRIYSNGLVGEERTYHAPLEPNKKSAKKSARYSARYVVKTEYNFKVAQNKKIVNVLLTYPAYRAIYFEKDGEVKALQAGDAFFDKIILTPFAFMKLLSEGKAI